MLIFGTKIVFFLMLMITIPFYFQVPYVMRLWLKNVPDYTILFVRLVTIHDLIDSISYPIMAVVQATGKIKIYQSVIGGLRIMNLPVSYIFLKLGFAPETVFIVEISISIITLILRIIITQKIVDFKFAFPFSKMLLLFIFLLVLTSVVPFFLINKMNSTFWQFSLFVIISVLWSGFCIFILGLNKIEKKKLLNKICRKRLS